jgi:hypothetical protein
MDPAPPRRRRVEAGDAVNGPRIAALALVLAALSGAAFAGDGHVEACEERCEEHYLECESKAEASADDCERKVSEVPAWIACECETDDTPEAAHCKPVCEKGEKALDKCEAKLEKTLDKCEEKSDACADRCND